MTVGERIKQKRIELGMSQEELAVKVGYKSRSSINKIELSRDLPLGKVQAVARALNCEPYYLMGWEDEPVELNPQKAVEHFAVLDMFERLNKTNQDIILDTMKSMINHQEKSGV